MNIYKLNKNLPNTDKIEYLNSMILELEGALEQGRFNKNELDEIYSFLFSRKFLRNQILGHTVSNYTDWSHLQAETGYSIWKITPTDYQYHLLNRLYFDDKLFENRGQADSESALTFDSVFLYDAESGAGYYNDHTAEAGTEGGGAIELLDSTSDYLYLGEATTFAGIKFEFQTRGSNHTLKVDYYNGSDWITLTANDNGLVDDTDNFESDGRITWTIPSDWTQNTVNSVSKYWIRISTTTTPVTQAQAYYIIPGNSVISLLALSEEEFNNEDWAWCTYSTNIYVTIRNTGNSAYEGDYYITSASSVTNLKNFFVYNHEYKADFRNFRYDPVVTVTGDGGLTSMDDVVLVDASSNSVVLTLPSAVGMEGKRFTIKALTIASGDANIKIEPHSGELIDNIWGFYSLDNDYAWVTLISDGNTWYVIGEKE